MPVVFLGLLIPLVMVTNALAALLIIPAFLNGLHGSRFTRRLPSS
jgi:hypothetical protein